MDYRRKHYHDERRRFPGFCVFPGYNWCGPGCSGPGAPVNAVDAACKEHDECYRRHGGPSCYCDDMFIRTLYQLQNPYTQEGRHARFLYQYMRMQMFFMC
ncbi:coat protein VP1 [Alteribacillus persepolensis]|uniref:Coat protein VP1 n=1 Tax=Alteribacillus persepolensis TaxID=568899 RepID=A0A1G8KAI2_9BACI|nr:phospholipase [Alteribacillus persepolensis]SDI40432.1 coat protein VP1 [Alteribacillus persepolensis]